MSDETEAPTPDEVAKARIYFAEPLDVVDRVLPQMARHVRVLLAALDAAEAETGPRLAKRQPCGCVVCTCEDPVRCNGCGSRPCYRHRSEPSSLWRDPGAVFEAHPLVERATKAEAEVECIRVALGGYPDSDLASLATTLRAREKVAETAEARVAELEAGLRDLADEYGPSDCRKRCLRLLGPSGSTGGGA